MNTTLKFSVAVITAALLSACGSTNAKPHADAFNTDASTTIPNPADANTGTTPESNGASTGNSASNNTAFPTPSFPNTPTQPDAPKPAEEKIKHPSTVAESKFDKDNQVWRKFKINDGHYDSLGNRESMTARYNKNIHKYFNKYVLSDSTYNNALYFDLNDKAPKMGVNSGRISDPNIAGDYKSFDFHVVNQPYSSYGVLFNNRGTDLFAFVNNNTGYETRDLQAGGHYKKAIAGTAHYKGNIIAQTNHRTTAPDDDWTHKKYSAPTIIKDDGTFTATLHLDSNDLSKGYAEAVLNSKTLGKIDLPRKYNVAGFNTVGVFIDNLIVNRPNGALVGHADLNFGGAELHDVVGGISLFNESAKTGEISHYKAVFGGTKQAK